MKAKILILALVGLSAGIFGTVATRIPATVRSAPVSAAQSIGSDDDFGGAEHKEHEGEGSYVVAEQEND